MKPSPILLPPPEISRKTARILLDTRSVLVNPSRPFTFTSGRKSPVYVDCRRLISFPEERSTLMTFAEELLVSRLGTENIDLLAGGETAGIPYAAFLAERMNKSMVYIRKQPKGFGQMAQIEGHFLKDNPQTVLIEDLQSEGTSKETFVRALRDAGAVIKHILVVFHYGIFPSSTRFMEDSGLNLHSLASWHDVIGLLEEEKLLSPEEITSTKSFLADPEGWSPDSQLASGS